MCRFVSVSCFSAFDVAVALVAVIYICIKRINGVIFSNIFNSTNLSKFKIIIKGLDPLRAKKTFIRKKSLCQF